jgi:high-affinity nickel permease
MQPSPSKNAVAAIRVSTTKQGTDSDSPEAQKEQIERYAENKGIVIKKFFLFLESVNKEQQPMQIYLVGTFFGELEYVAVQLKALGVLSTEDLRGLRIRKPPRLTKSPVFAG